ncbi:MAG: tol-pal system protein YbgF [Burkholderiales bacterium]
MIRVRRLALLTVLVAGFQLTAPGVSAQSAPAEPVQDSAVMMLAQADSATSASRPEARAMVQLMNQLDELNRELSKLRGKVEELSNSILNAEKRQKDMYLDLDTRLRRIEASNTDIVDGFKKAAGDLSELRARVEALEQSADLGSTLPSTTSMSSENAAANADVLRAYEGAMAKYRGAKYQDAITEFQAIVKQFPNHPLAANAQYWTGDSYYQLRAYRSAVDAQKELIAKYPSSGKVPDAMLNMGSGLIGLNEIQQARKTWETLISSYPGSRAARNAQERLQRLP